MQVRKTQALERELKKLNNIRSVLKITADWYGVQANEEMAMKDQQLQNIQDSIAQQQTILDGMEAEVNASRVQAEAMADSIVRQAEQASLSILTGAQREAVSIKQKAVLQLSEADAIREEASKMMRAADIATAQAEAMFLQMSCALVSKVEGLTMEMCRKAMQEAKITDLTDD